MLKGGVIMDVTQCRASQIAEKAGAVCVMALERVPSDIPQRRRRGAHGLHQNHSRYMKTVTIR